MPASMPIAAPSPDDARRDRLALEAAGLGIWELDIASGRTTWNAQMFAIHGLTADHSPLTFDEWLARVHPDDRSAIETAFSQLLENPTPLNLEFRIFRENGEVCHLRSVTRVIPLDDAEPRWLVGVNEDVTDQARDRQRAESMQRDLQNFFNVSMNLMCIISLEGEFQTVNQAWQPIMGHTESDLLGRCILDLVHPDDLAGARGAIAALSDGQELVGFINRIRHRDGSYRHIEWRATSCDRQIYAIAHNVSDRLALERRLAEKTNYLQLIIDSLPNPVFAKDWQGRHILANDSVARLFGTTKQALMGRNDHSMSARPEEIEAFLRDDREVMQTGQIKYIPEEALTDAQGEQHWFQTVKVPLMTERPVEERQVLGIATDITERRRDEQRLQRQEQLYRSLVESQHDLIVRVDADNRFTFVNDAYCTTFGKSRQELIGETFSPLVHEEDLPHTLAAVKRLKQPPHSRVTIVQRARTQAGWRWLAWEDSVILDASGNLEEIQAVGRDISDLKEAQQRALSSSRVKSQFLANMSHEIRTPLNAIIGFSELLSHSRLNAEQYDWNSKIITSSKLLQSIIEDILDVTKIEAGKVTLERVPFTLNQLISQQHTLFDIAAGEKGLRFRVLHEGKRQLALMGDPLRLGQVLTNLVGNAIKFTSRGEVTLQLNVEAIEGASCRLTCQVIDTGIGISAEQEKHLFTPFFQADSSTSRRFGGAGLGLVICKRLVEEMGGTLGVSSVPGEGSCFSFSLTLPVSAAPSDYQVSTLPLETRCLAGKRVLLAEDNPINQALTRRLLEDLGLEVVIANNGQEVLQHLESDEIDLVLMDLQMPVMDGFETARRIRQHDAALPIIALSAAVLAEERQQALIEGMNEHLAKPIASQQLAAALIRWLSDAPPARAASAADDSDAGWLHTLESHGFDTQAGLATAADDRCLYRQVLGVFQEQLESRFTALGQPSSSLDTTPAILEDLHTLKGTAGSLGAMDIAKSALHLETCLKHDGHARHEDIKRLSKALESAQRGLALALNR